MLKIRRISNSIDPGWLQSRQIYRDQFPSDEREPEAVLCAGIDSGEYQLWVGEYDGTVVGFYILSLYPVHNYVLFSYLAVAGQHQGQGIGRELCRHAIATTQTAATCQWLFVEAQARQARYYGGLGFLMLDYQYLAPCFDSHESIAMSLLAVAVNNQTKHIEINELNDIVEHMFVVGYQLEPGDLRLQQQLSCHQSTIALIAWA